MTDMGRNDERREEPAQELRDEVSLRDEERSIEGADPDIAVTAPDEEREEPVVTEDREVAPDGDREIAMGTDDESPADVNPWPEESVDRD